MSAFLIVKLGRQVVVGLAACLLVAPVGAALQPLKPTDVMPGCGCGFYASEARDAPLLLHWSQIGGRQAVMRDGNKLYYIGLHNARYYPTERNPAQNGDRMVLYFATPQWQVQAVGTVVDACRSKQSSCATVYKARLLVQYEGGAQQSTEVVGRCGC
ncbi:MAG: hypothetical protein QM803_01645 [Rhodocyclaceae bacterium]